MAISSVNNNGNTYTPAITDPANTSAAKTAESAAAESKEAAVYKKEEQNKTDSTNQIYDRDSIVTKLKADQQSRIDSMQSLVQKLLAKQANQASYAFDLTSATNLADTFRQISGDVDQQTIDKAKESISENGYWGVNQTSDRLVSMAIALSGDDTSKADLLMESIEKGFEKATAAWGEKLPQICQDTLETTRQKMTDWKNGVTNAADYSFYLK